uniref:NADH-ubiquinone oxidoreductase chain 6 n=1 Tax=Cyema atrum TaxID=556252 RepID=D1YUE9_9TELE|nr:NADH dehydrogenase subunit 6 [Cyema atrum]BAI53533.1 NADH dehydrogenase subunit 6 [Cyema atrum]
MFYMILSFLTVMLCGVVVVCSGPSPYFGVMGLVAASAGGCGLLIGYGGSFIAVVLILVYLGGMLVVFAYSAALAAEPYPEPWGDYLVTVSIYLYSTMVLCWVYNFYLECKSASNYILVVDENGHFTLFPNELVGIPVMYNLGGGMSVICGWALLLTLFVVFSVLNNRGQGALRAL